MLHLGIDFGTESTKVSYFCNERKKICHLMFGEKEFVYSSYIPPRDGENEKLGDSPPSTVIEGGVIKINTNLESQDSISTDRIKINTDYFKGFFTLLWKKIYSLLVNKPKNGEDNFQFKADEVIETVNVGFPPCFNFATRQNYTEILKECFSGISSDKIKIYNETLASFVALKKYYLPNDIRPGIYLIIDSGAGTTDASVVNFENDRIFVEWTKGVNYAGNNIDEEMLEFLNLNQQGQQFNLIQAKELKEKIVNELLQMSDVDSQQVQQYVEKKYRINYDNLKKFWGNIFSNNIFSKIFDDDFKEKYLRRISKVFFVGKTTLIDECQNQLSEVLGLNRLNRNIIYQFDSLDRRKKLLRLLVQTV